MFQAERTAKSYARRQHRSTDRAFVDECVAEAWFIVCELIYDIGVFNALKEKFPDYDVRATFFRQRVGYDLKEYFSTRSTSTESYLRKKGINYRPVQLTTEIVIPVDPEHLTLEVYESVVRDEFERLVVEYRCMGKRIEKIAEDCGCTTKRVKKTLNRIKRRLLNP